MSLLNIREDKKSKNNFPATDDKSSKADVHEKMDAKRDAGECPFC
jgi:hypothetical protein